MKSLFRELSMAQTNRSLLFTGNKKPGEMEFRHDVIV